MALGIERVNEATTLGLRSVVSSWAGLRTFAPDRVPVVGEDPRRSGLFWLVGQGGYGIQTAPAVARCLAGLVAGTGLPPDVTALGVSEAQLSPARFASLTPARRVGRPPVAGVAGAGGLAAWPPPSPRRSCPRWRPPSARSADVNAGRARQGVRGHGTDQTGGMQPMTLTPEQQEFRAVVRQFAEDKLAPLAAETDRTRRVLVAGVRGAAIDGADRPAVPRGVRRQRAPTSSPRPSWPRSWPAWTPRPASSSSSRSWPCCRSSTSASDELKARYLPRIATGESQAQLLPVRGRRRVGRRVDDHAGGARRRRLRAVRHEGVDHQRRHLATSTRCSPRPIRRPGTGASARSWSSGTGACRSPSSSTSWASRARRPRRSCSTRCGCRPPTASARRARASSTPCTRSTAAVRPSARRPSASRRARWTTPSAT